MTRSFSNTPSKVFAEMQTVIDAEQNSNRNYWKEIFDYKDLLFLLVRRDFVSKYKQTVLGPIWFILQPLLTTLVFTLIFGKVAKIPTDQLPPTLFYLCGLLAWDYFALCMSGVSSCLLVNSNLLKKVYFPRLIIPLSVMISNLMKYGLQLTVFLGFFFYFKFCTSASQFINPGGWLVLLPVAVLISMLSSLGAGLLVCAMTVKNRDLQHLVSFSVQLWMYGTPVIYPLSAVPEKWRWLVLLNPMTEVVEFYRLAFFGSGTISLFAGLVCVAVTASLFLSGLFFFNREEKNFVDTI